MLDTETVSSFHAGVYDNWQVSGNVVIKITKLTGANAVLSGLFIDPPSTSATFLKQDTTTQGNWINTYGTQGYEVIGNATSLPSYATVTPSGQATYTWTASTTDPRALQDAGGTGRIAAAWYSTTSFTVDVDFTDGKTHDLELYFLDWDSTGRSEQVQISNASTGAVLDTETVSSFHAGVYDNWQVSGNVVITITRLTGAQRGPQRPVHRPDPVGDVPQAGHDDARKLDRYLRHAGLRRHRQRDQPPLLRHRHAQRPDELYLGGQHHRPPALQSASGTGRIAATWYSSTSFTVDVDLTDGQTHDLELYFLDWDSTARSEQIQISNAGTGAVLNTETVSSFHSGVYLNWTVQRERADHDHEAGRCQRRAQRAVPRPDELSPRRRLPGPTRRISSTARP